MGTPRLELGGADFFLHLFGTYWLRHGGTNNVALVVECEGFLEPERLERSVARFLELCPWPAARLRRRFAWSLPCWEMPADRGPPRLDVVYTTGSAASYVDSDLNAPIVPWREPPLRLRVVHHASGSSSTLIMTWYHSLMDPRGAEHLIAWLAGVDAAGNQRLAHAGEMLFVVPRDLRSLRTRGPLALRSLRPLRELQRKPPRSLFNDARDIGLVRWRQLRCTAPLHSARHSEEMSYRLAVVGRAVAELMARRGIPLVDFVVPIAVDRRRKRDTGPIIGNDIGILFARFAPDAVRDPGDVARELRAQMADALRDDLVEASWVGMNLMRELPVYLALRNVRKSLRRDMCSFNCADTGSFALEANGFCGASIRNAYHVPGVYPRPGLGLFLNRCGGRHNLVVVWVDGIVAAEEITQLTEMIRDGLGWDTAR